MIFKVYIFIHKIRIGVLKIIEKKSREIYASKIRIFLAYNLPISEESESRKTTLRIDRVALSIAKTIKNSDNEYIWQSALTHDGSKNTIFGLEYLSTNPKFEDGLTIVTEVLNGEDVYISLTPDVMQDFLYNQARKADNND